MTLLGSTNHLQDIDTTQDFARKRWNSSRCDTALSHAALAESPPPPSKSAISARPDCRTSLSPKRRPTGLWLRGAVWQFRTRIPADLRTVLGRTHINRSLRTGSYPDAIRAARKVAFEIEGMFDAVRGGIGSDTAHATCDRFCPSLPAPSNTADAILPDPTGPAIHIDLDALVSRIAEKLRAAQPVAGDAARPAAEPAKVKTIQQVYDAYMADPGVIRSGKTVLAYETVFGLLIEIIGQNTPVSDISRETCREIMETLRWLPPN